MPSAVGDFKLSGSTFTWSLPPDASQINALYLDLSYDSGFVYYYSQTQLPVNSTSFGLSALPVNIGDLYARVNAHYGVSNDRGWFPSVTVILHTGMAQLIAGEAPESLSWAPPILSWINPVTENLTLAALDMSLYRDFNDILQAPFITPVNNQVSVDALPFSAQLSPSTTQLGIMNMPIGQEFFLRLNNMFGYRTWYTSNIMHFFPDGHWVIETSGSSPWPLVLIAGIGILVLSRFLK